jgi:hypothetical protein
MDAQPDCSRQIVGPQSPPSWTIQLLNKESRRHRRTTPHCGHAIRNLSAAQFEWFDIPRWRSKKA